MGTRPLLRLGCGSDKVQIAKEQSRGMPGPKQVGVGWGGSNKFGNGMGARTP